MRNYKTPVLLTGLLAFLLIATGMTQQEEPQVGEVGSTVSEFSLTTYDGKTFTNADLKEKVTLLIFWYPT